MSDLSLRINEDLAKRREQGLLRRRVVVDQSAWVNFCSNDYLSLRMDGRIKQAYQQGYMHHSAGSGASPMVSGYHSIHQQLEKTFAEYLAVDDALLFSSGYAANLGVMALLAALGAYVVMDKAVHASCYDGIKNASADYERFLPNNMEDLARLLGQNPANSVVMTEGIFSMSGQCASLDRIAKLAPLTIVDEAHSFGVMGEQGMGAVVHFSLTQQEVPLRIITFGKAMGGQGAVVAGRGDWIEALLQHARAQIYSTALSPALCYGLLHTLHVLYEADDRRAQLRTLIHYFRDKVRASPLTFADSHTAIQQLQLGCPHRALYFAEQLQRGGIFCLAMRKPTVSLEHTGLRIVLNYSHTFRDIDLLFTLLHACYDSKYPS